MEETKNKLELQVNDLVLMNVVGVGEDGPIFGVVDRVGTMELLGEEAVASPIVESTNEQVTTDTAESEKLGKAGGSSGQVAASVIAELEVRRAALDAAIQELKRDMVNSNIPPIGDEVTIPQVPLQHSDEKPNNAKGRKMCR